MQPSHDAWPDKALLSTEGSQERGPPAGQWNQAERYALNRQPPMSRIPL